MTAAQLASLLLLMIFVLLVLERWSRGARRYHHMSAYHRALPSYELRGAKKVRRLARLRAAGAARLRAAVGRASGVDRRERRRSPSMPPICASSSTRCGWRRFGAVLTVIVAGLLAYAGRLRQTPVVLGAARFAALGYGIPGTVLAVGIMLPFIGLDNLVDGFARSTFGVSTGLLLSGTLGGRGLRLCRALPRGRPQSDRGRPGAGDAVDGRGRARAGRRADRGAGARACAAGRRRHHDRGDPGVGRSASRSCRRP